MIESIFHMLGICPDSIGHIDLMDIVICYYNEIQNIITLIRFRSGL
jgi:hypothetical protein